MAYDTNTIAERIGRELSVKSAQVAATIDLLNEGATVPFIARYRKEMTQGLDDTQLRFLADRLYYLRELDARREAIIQSIQEQEKLTPELIQALQDADTKARLEDIYLPYRPKRRTKATQAKEAGLEPLAHALLTNTAALPMDLAAAYVNSELGIDSAEAALEGARQIILEMIAEDATLLELFRQYLWQHGALKSTAAKKKKAEQHKFNDYLNYLEPLKKIPSHRALALFRGRREEVLQLNILCEAAEQYVSQQMAEHLHRIYQANITDACLLDLMQLAWKTKMFPKLELELMARLRELADDEAIKVFSMNLRDLLLAAPAGAQVTMGLDPGIRTGVKAAVVDATGKLLDYATIYPMPPQNAWHDSLVVLAKLIAKHHVSLVSIGNGTGSRETDRLVTELSKMYPDLLFNKVMVSEAGASVYSASALAAEEFPDLDVTLRGAVSIARRLQDPLAELVKIDPKSIGVGQYQHDVNATRLTRTLAGVVEDCVNLVGVDVNTASAALLTHIAGLNETLAKNIVEYRNEHGAFQAREQLKNVTRLGEKVFQQAAGFLRIPHGQNPLDASGVHPEAYPLVDRLLKACQKDLSQVLGCTALQGVNAADFVDDQFGLPTIQDVLRELEKPGRDPRPSFKTATFKEGVEELSHLSLGMELEGVVSNVTNFGAFVDIGVHQDGLVHISALSNRFVSDPHQVVKAGDVVKVKVIEVDLVRRRIGLSMNFQEDKTVTKPVEKMSDRKREKKVEKKPEHPRKPENKKKPIVKPVIMNTAMADALSKLKRTDA